MRDQGRGVMSRPVIVYAYLNEVGEYLYIGQTHRLDARHAWHRSTSRWFNDALPPIVLSEWPTRREALEDEAAAIRFFKPRHNIHHADADRRECVGCGRTLNLRSDGNVPLHRTREHEPCDGGHRLPVDSEAVA